MSGHTHPGSDNDRKQKNNEPWRHLYGAIALEEKNSPGLDDSSSNNGNKNYNYNLNFRNEIVIRIYLVQVLKSQLKVFRARTHQHFLA